MAGASGNPVDARVQEAAALLQRGALAECEALADRLSRDAPQHAGAWHLLGLARLMAGRPAEAVAPLDQACRLHPANLDAWDHLGAAYHQLGEWPRASECFAHGLAAPTPRLGTLVNAAANAVSAGRFSEGVDLSRQALALREDLPGLHLNLANALAGLGQTEAAIAAYQRALALQPDMPQALLSLGGLLERYSQSGEAIRVLDRCQRLGPPDWRVQFNLAKAHSNLGHTAQALAAYRRTLELNPQAAEAHSGMLMMLMHADGQDPQAVHRAHLEFGQRYEAPLRAAWRPHDNPRDPDRRLRIGIVSGDLRRHAVAFFVEPLFQRLDPDRVELVAYYNHPQEDEVSQRLRTHFAAWHPVIGLSDGDLAQRIRDDGIDILVDLSGHTAYNRLLVFARKPAPIQVTWLGYPGTTGLSAMDYRLVMRHSRFALAQPDRYTEKFAVLPCVSAFQPPADAPPVNDLPALARGYVTFANFNRANKVGAPVIALWARILRALPTARMLLGAVEPDQAQPLLDAFGAHGIPPDRLDVHPRVGMADYLALHHQVDLILDSFPYSGGTTSRHALWMGVPVLGLGREGAMQAGAAVVSVVGNLPDWLAADEDDYFRKALAFAADLPALAALRADLRDRILHNPLAQPDYIARCYEAAFRSMWRRWCAGEPAARFEVQP